MLDNHFKENQGTGTSAFSLYYFPEIPSGNKHSKVDKAMTRSAESAYTKTFNSFGNQSEGTVSEDKKIQRRLQEEYAKGFEDGEKKGSKVERRQMEPAIKSLESAVAKILDKIHTVRSNAEIEVVSLAMEIAKKILGMEIQTNPEVVCNVVKQAMEKVVDATRIIIRLNPGDIEIIDGQGEGTKNLIPKGDEIQIQPDASIGRGGCMIETKFGDIDARIEKQMEIIEEILNTELSKATRMGPTVEPGN